MSSSSAREAELEAELKTAKEAITQLHAQQKELYEQFGTLVQVRPAAQQHREPAWHPANAI